MKKEIGATWHKWDLHVHTPNSIIHHFNGSNDEEQWKKFIDDIESLPPEIKVLGINDYFSIDGYKHILAEKKRGRMKNIELFLPIVELRTSDFGGTEKFSRINYHVIFSNDIDPEDIQNLFINNLRTTYVLDDGNEWHGGVSKKDLISLGEKIKETSPTENQSSKSPLKIGFSNFNMPIEKIRSILSSEKMFEGKYLTAIGKNEWTNMKWNDNTIANKKHLINSADFVFTAAVDVDLFNKGKDNLTKSFVNNKLIDASDAHNNIDSKLKDKLGNVMTWIKADLSFQGLIQASNEYEHRVFVGQKPKKLLHLEKYPEKFISEIKLKPMPNRQDFFKEQSIPLNYNLVAIIGNKGNGKSALADILGLLGHTRNYKEFSFLTSHKFRKNNLAKNYNAEINWANSQTYEKNLNENPTDSSIELVKYLPQQYLEKLCNDFQGEEFENELKKVIFSHIPKHEKISTTNLNELIHLKTSRIQQTIDIKRKELEEINRKILQLESDSTDIEKEKLHNQLEQYEITIKSHEDNKPKAPYIPQKSMTEVQTNLQKTNEELDSYRNQLNLSNDVFSTLNVKKLNLEIIKDSISNIQNEICKLIDNYPEYNLSQFINFTFNEEKFDEEAVNNSKKIDDTLQKIDELKNNISNYEGEIEILNSKLDEPSRIQQEYENSLRIWQEKNDEIIHLKDTINKKIDSLKKDLPKEIEELKKERLQVVKEIFMQLQSINDQYELLYKPVSEFIFNNQIKTSKLNLNFEAKLHIENLNEKMIDFINFSKKSSFQKESDDNYFLKKLLDEENIIDNFELFKTNFLEIIEEKLLTKFSNQYEGLSYLLKPSKNSLEFLNWFYSLEFLKPKYNLKLDNKNLDSLSPGEKGALLLIFYLLIDKESVPLIIDQPEENLDNQTIFNLLVPCIREAKKHRQIIIVTHNPNLAVVCDAEQIIWAEMKKECDNTIEYTSGAIENPLINSKIIDILEGTLPAFNNRKMKYSPSI